jgi:hypothetical protein
MKIKSTRGRKPVADKKIPVTIYLTKSTIQANGGAIHLKDDLIMYSKKKAIETNPNFEAMDSIIKHFNI